MITSFSYKIKQFIKLIVYCKNSLVDKAAGLLKEGIILKIK